MEALFDVNPFLGELEVTQKERAGEKMEGHEQLYDKDGRLIETRWQRVHYVDDATFLKIFIGHLSAWDGLSPAATKIVFAIMQEIAKTPRQDLVYLSHTDTYFVDTKGVKQLVPKSTFYRGIKDLESKGFIKSHKTKTYCYWINPAYFFNGDRLTYIDTWVKKANESGAGTQCLPKIKKRTPLKMQTQESVYAEDQTSAP